MIQPPAVKAIISRLSLKKPQKLLGFVEELDVSGLRGWVHIPGAERIEVKLRIGKKTIDLQPNWVSRNDVAASLGIKSGRHGFVYQFDSETSEHLDIALDNGAIVEVLANGQMLPLVPNAKKTRKSLNWERLDIHQQSESVESCIETWGGFILRGWAIVDGGAPKSLNLVVNGEDHPLHAIWRERDDIAEARPGISSSRVGFEVHLEAHLWNGVEPPAGAEFDLFADGHKLTTRPLKLSRDKVTRWTEEIVDLSDPRQRQFCTLLALEHLHAIDVASQLAPAAQRYIVDFVRLTKLHDYMPRSLDSAAVVQSQDGTSPHLVRAALRTLNERLEDAPASEVLTRATAVADEMGLEGGEREFFFFKIASHLCRLDLGEQLLMLERLYHWERYGESDDVWQLTIGVVIHVLLGKIASATPLLWKLSNQRDRALPNAACIHFAVREVMRQGRADTAQWPDTEKFHYAVIGWLDAFGGAWFSPLHDVELIQAMVALFDDWHTYADYFRRDLVKAAIRIYGLSPTFWRILEARHGDLHNLELDQARAHWHIVAASLRTEISTEVRQLQPLVESLRYFRHMESREATQFLREVAVHILASFSQDRSLAGRGLIQMLLDNPIEGMRLAAYPLPDAGRLREDFTECGDRLMSELRVMGAEHRSVFFDVQREASVLAEQIIDAGSSNDADTISALLQQLHTIARHMNNAEVRFLGADLLAFCYEAAADAGLECDSIISSLEQSVSTAIEQTGSHGWLPAPVHSAIARLSRRGGGKDVRIEIFMEAVLTQIQQKFGDYPGLDVHREIDPHLQPTASGLNNDTLVIIYSCRKNLDTSIKAIRDSWAQDLKARNISYLFLVGGGDSTINGDVLELDTPDNYEDLPRKTLDLIEWVVNKTDFEYLYKIDDDCFLDADQFFRNISYRKHHYYGRLLNRGIGSMSRTWHRSKSHSRHAQARLDKSPEPSAYADGGSGYSLSRHAMRQVLEARESYKGQWLISVSLNEDKLVGDLLATAQIYPCGEDYQCYLRRRTFGAAVPVGIYENLFYPSALTPTVMTHLDTGTEFSGVRKLTGKAELWPKKIWPTPTAPSIGYNKNQLDLLVDIEKFQSVVEKSFHIVSVVRNEMTMLKHFLAHYRKIGAESFIIVDNLSDDGSREYLLQQPDVALFSADTDYSASHYGVAWQQAILGSLCLGKWVLLADADEFLVYPDCERRTIFDFIAEVEAEQADCVRVNMVDMYPFGDLSEADFDLQAPFEAAPWFDKSPFTAWRLARGSFSNGQTYLSTMRHRIDPTAEPNSFTAQKHPLFRYKSWMRFSQGIHDAAEVTLSSRTARFAHFKYHKDFQRKVEAEVRRGQHFDNAKEYRRYAAMLAETNGHFGDKELSAKYVDSSSFFSSGNKGHEA